MNKIIFFLWGLIILNQAVAQSDIKKFDITTYQTITNFKEELFGNVAMKLSYKNNKEAVEVYIYKARPTSGNAMQDFKDFWVNDFKTKPLPVDNALQQETRTDGVKVVYGVGGSKKNFYVISTHTLEKSMVPVFITANTTKYNKEIEAFVDALSFDQSIATTIPVKPTTNSNLPKGNTNAIVNNNSNTSNPPEIFKDKYITGSGIFSDYSYIIPPAGKSTFHQQYTNLIKVKNDDINESAQPFWIDIFPLELSSGSLQTDADNIIAKYNPGYVPFIRSGGTSSNISLEKGRTIQGFEYLKVKKELIKRTDNNSDVKSEVAAVIKVGNKVASILLEEHIDALWDKGDKALAFILMTIRFNNIVAPGYNLQKDILGTWGRVGTTGGYAYSYYGTNTFDWNGASQTRTSKDTDYDYVYTKTFGGTGSYSLKGNVMTEVWKATKTVTNKLISAVQRKVNAEPWQFYLWEIGIDPKDCECDGLPCLSNFWQPSSRW
jgi:hypothetical protein